MHVCVCVCVCMFACICLCLCLCLHYDACAVDQMTLYSAPLTPQPTPSKPTASESQVITLHLPCASVSATSMDSGTAWNYHLFVTSDWLSADHGLAAKPRVSTRLLGSNMPCVFTRSLLFALVLCSGSLGSRC